MLAIQYEAIPDIESAPLTVHGGGLKSRQHHRFSKARIIAALICLAIIIGMIASAVVSSGYPPLGKTKICKPKDITPPYLYITLHKGPNILKYTTSGCLVSDEVLHGGLVKGSTMQFRSMLLGKLEDQNDTLIVTDSTKSDSRVMVYSSCSGRSGKRDYLIDVIDEVGFPYNNRRGATHPYGVAQDKNGYIYASFQDTNAVLRFMYNADVPAPQNIGVKFNVPGSFIPVPAPPKLPKFDGDSKKEIKYYNGTFVQLGLPSKEGGDSDLGIRAIMYVDDLLWVANEDLDGLFVVDSEGKYVNFVKIKKPIGLLYVKEKHLMYVSTKDSKVYAVDTKLYLVRYDLHNPYGWNHPTGMAQHGSSLFIADQNQGTIYLYNVDSTLYEQRLISGLGRVEQLLISEC